MSNQLAIADSHSPAVAGGNHKEFVTMRLNGQLFGIPVNYVQDVLRPQKIAAVPLAPPEVAGLINLRGRIVTVIDMRKKLSLPENNDRTGTMMVVIEHRHELYSLIVDSIGEVLKLSPKDFDLTPPNISSAWQAYAAGVYRLEEELMVVIEASSLLPQESKLETV
ncbi:MAG: chemotaxis protein CheW [Alphaproteobacteria bacterium]|nr:chemotaxis protein CheW [Alphaproteobacteria bacterium]